MDGWTEIPHVLQDFVRFGAAALKGIAAPSQSRRIMPGIVFDPETDQQMNGPTNGPTNGSTDGHTLL